MHELPDHPASQRVRAANYAVARGHRTLLAGVAAASLLIGGVGLTQSTEASASHKQDPHSKITSCPLHLRATIMGGTDKPIPGKLSVKGVSLDKYGNVNKWSWHLGRHIKLCGIEGLVYSGPKPVKVFPHPTKATSTGGYYIDKPSNPHKGIGEFIVYARPAGRSK